MPHRRQRLLPRVSAMLVRGVLVLHNLHALQAHDRRADQRHHRSGTGEYEQAGGGVQGSVPAVVHSAAGHLLAPRRQAPGGSGEPRQKQQGG